MRLASCILSTPVMLNGRAVRELESEGELTIESDKTGQLIEVWLRGKLICWVPFHGVLSMRPAELPFACPECPERCQDERGLGAHRYQKHGVAGQARAKK